ncbi:hypothetical protein CEXT_409421 [Caerostris extrusa]|uniref:Uncharacterized protein n=1 Tax=Caerostris extrusa TaxID=172846 RepID=A0AAV4Y373_CAEEX|nr:hypothetical protein CEXT_409421 [Caerostris extrusa]
MVPLLIWNVFWEGIVREGIKFRRSQKKESREGNFCSPSTVSFGDDSLVLKALFGKSRNKFYPFLFFRLRSIELNGQSVKVESILTLDLNQN